MDCEVSHYTSQEERQRKNVADDGRAGNRSLEVSRPVCNWPVAIISQAFFQATTCLPLEASPRKILGLELSDRENIFSGLSLLRSEVANDGLKRQGKHVWIDSLIPL